jgi:hypothetical protein
MDERANLEILSALTIQSASNRKSYGIGDGGLEIGDGNAVETP